MRCAYAIGQALQRRRRGESIRVEQDQPRGLNFYSRRGGRALRTRRHRHGASCGDVGKEVMAY
ncbi:hypothetical protein [Variovorax sp. CF079]|uniref:hypothetical protein n=1 Tax=Variovorax sp. CF079 TaxID=1882774 RepID=UPI00147D164C|nr:hypothetical protein [Variovorax sp. CF079]